MWLFITVLHRILVLNIAKSCIFAVFFDYSTKKIKVESMKLKNIQSSRPTQSWIKRRDRNPQIKKSLHSQLRDWVQSVIMEAEKNKDFKKKDQFLSLLEDLNTTEN